MSILIADVILAFLFTKGIFLFFGWITKYDGDLLYRKNIDKFLDVLENKSVYEVFVEYIHVLVSKMQDVFSSAKFKYFVFPLSVYFINVLLYYYVTFYRLQVDGINVHEYYYRLLIKNFPSCTVYYNPVFGMFIGPLFLTIIGILSVAITIKLLQRASRTNSRLNLFILFILDLSFCLVFWFVIRKFSFFVEGVGRGIGTLITCYPNYDKFDMYFKSTVETGLWILNNFKPASVYFFLGITSYLPTISYVVIVLPILLMVFQPRATRHVLFLITTDNKPIMTQLGNFFGVIAVFLSLVVDYLAR